MNRRIGLAIIVLMIMAIAVLLPMGGLLSVANLPGFESADLKPWQNHYIQSVLWFSLWQAGLSALLSVIPAVFVARALYFSGPFPGRSLILRLFALPLVVPSVVAVMAIVSVYGSQGPVPLGRSLYGINGILLAHVFFNLPLAIRLLLPLWQSVPKHHWQLAKQLNFGVMARFRYLEWPQMKEGLPGVLLLVFMLCLTSFAVVLTLGGGPRSTTLEVAIYQSLRFDFDPAQAVILAIMQLTLCALVAMLTFGMQKMPEVEMTIEQTGSSYHNERSLFQRILILIAVLFVAGPIFMILVDAVRGPLLEGLSSTKLWRAAAYTLMIGFCSAFLATFAAWMLIQGSSDLAHRGKPQTAKMLETSASIVYVIPPLVIGTGYFVLMSPHVNVFNWVFPIVIGVNSLMGLPFVIRTLGPAMRQHHARHHELCQQLSLTGFNRLRWVDWPLLRKPVGLSAALVAALAMGDLGVIALFGTTESTTLPLLVYQQLGAYRIPQATVTAVFLLFVCVTGYWLIERGLGGKTNA
ncbi:MAG: thiamine/thiamine pyrophosphate ABC transporter permease [Pseudomonadota bacterium]